MLAIMVLALILVWYPALTWLLGFSPFETLDFGIAFNSMAAHLLAGRFDIDPGAIGAEGFEVGGRTVSYFGIFCALLRLPLVLTPGLANLDITWWSCLIATYLAAWFQVRAIGLIRIDTPRQNWLAGGLLMCVALGGAHIPYLRPSIYQEPIDWAYAQAMGFVLLAVRGLTLAKGFDGRTLCLMALCAGLALLTRVTFGIGLYAALGLLLLARGQIRTGLAPAGILLAFAAATGIVNQGRWSDPLTFADFSLYGLSQDIAPDRLGRLAAYGTFHPARIWLGLCYYFVPVWIWPRADGHVLFAEAQATLIDAMELPPGSFFLTDPLLLWLAAAGVLAVRDRVRAALLTGLAVPAVLMLCAISMAHRYRLEFYPLLFLAALFAPRTPATIDGPPRRTAWFRRAVIAAVVVSVVASHAMAVLYARSPWGPGDGYLERYGLVGTYTKRDR